MANPYSGEVALVVDGQERIAKLTLGALCELEAALGETSMIGLAERFESGRFASSDVMAVLVAGLRGGGMRCNAADLTAAEFGGGPIAAAQAAAELLARAFRIPE